jgi:hypothetical protein
MEVEKTTTTNHAFSSFSFFEAFSVHLRITCLPDATQDACAVHYTA